MSFSIRPAQPGDRAAWLQMVLDYDPDIPSQTDEAWRRIFDPASSAACQIATQDDQPVAFMHYLMHDFCFSAGPVCYLADLYVTPEFRRQGIARMMIDHLMNLARESGWSRVYWVTEPDNPARPMYDEIGAAGFVRYHKDLCT